MARSSLREAGWNEPVTVVPEGAQPGDGQAYDTTAWNAAAIEQERERKAAEDAETQRYGEQVMSDFDNLVAKGNQRRAESRRMKDATLSAMILQARNGNGYVPPDVLDAASENMGFRVAGGNFDKKGNFILYGLQQGEDGSAQMAPVAIASPGMQLQTLSRAKMGLEYQREIYEGLSRRYTPEQLEKRGYANPDSPQVVGSTTMSGSAARRLFGMGGPERRGVSSFSADGKGGFSRTHTGPDGVTTREDFGTRDPNYKGRWKQISVGPDPDDKKFDENGNEVNNPNPRQIRRYENDKTGEVVSVRDGETPPWEQTERTRTAQINARAQAERDAAKIKAQKDVAEINAAGRVLFRNSGGRSSGGNSMKEVIDALSKMQTHLNENGANMTEEERQQMQQAIKAGFSGLVSWFSPQKTNGAKTETDTSLPEGMKEGDEVEHKGKTYVLGYKDGKPMWLLKGKNKNVGGTK